MIVMAIVLVSGSILAIMAYEISAYKGRRWGENTRGFF